jgi:hypothetical protein
LNPGLEIVAENSDLRDIFSEHGVESHCIPLVVFTAAPGGVVFTSHAVVVPRVTVAQAPKDAHAAASAAIAPVFI